MPSRGKVPVDKGRLSVERRIGVCRRVKSMLEKGECLGRAVAGRDSSSASGRRV